MGPQKVVFYERWSFISGTNLHSIGVKIAKTGVITREPTYHAQVWEYPPQGNFTGLFFHKICDWLPY